MSSAGRPLGKTGLAVLGRGSFFGCEPAACSQKLRERQAQRTESADPQDFPSGDAIAQPGSVAANAEHGRFLTCENYINTILSDRLAVSIPSEENANHET